MHGQLAFGVVGVNPRIRRAILAGIVASRRARLAAVCSRDGAKAAAVVADLGGTAYTSFDAMLADPEVEAVFICTPHALHHPMALQALKAGKRVVCEKPLALRVEEAEELVAAARESAWPTAVNFTYHSLPGQSFVARLLAEGEIGRLRHLELSYFQGRQALPEATHTDALLEVGSHEIDLAVWWLAGAGAGPIRGAFAMEDVRSAPATAEPWRPILCAILAAESGTLVTLQANRIAAGWRNGMVARLVGDEGSIRLDFDTDRVSVEVAHFGDGGPEGTFRVRPIPPDLAVEYAEFPAFHLDRIVGALHGESSFPDFAHGLRVQRVMAAVRQSSESRAWVPVTTDGIH